jgi:co-chaperonin GroES (HSP10)
MAVIPTGHRVMVKLQQLEEYDEVFANARKSGIEIPEFTKRKEETVIDTGRVVAIGKTAFIDFGGEPWCEVGDLVAYARHSGKRVKDPVDDEDYLILNDEDIVAVLKEDK